MPALFLPVETSFSVKTFQLIVPGNTIPAPSIVLPG